jgi:hypothetical protein
MRSANLRGRSSEQPAIRTLPFTAYLDNYKEL